MITEGVMKQIREAIVSLESRGFLEILYLGAPTSEEETPDGTISKVEIILGDEDVPEVGEQGPWFQLAGDLRILTGHDGRSKVSVDLDTQVWYGDRTTDGQAVAWGACIEAFPSSTLALEERVIQEVLSHLLFGRQ